MTRVGHRPRERSRDEAHLRASVMNFDRRDAARESGRAIQHEKQYLPLLLEGHVA